MCHGRSFSLGTPVVDCRACDSRNVAGILARVAGLPAAERCDDPDAEAIARRALGEAYALLGEHSRAGVHLQRSLAIAEAAADLNGQAQSHRSLAYAYAEQEADAPALHHATRALHRYGSLDQPARRADALNSVGWLSIHNGQLSAARRRCRRRWRCAASTTG